MISTSGQAGARDWPWPGAESEGLIHWGARRTGVKCDARNCAASVPPSPALRPSVRRGHSWLVHRHPLARPERRPGVLPRSPTSSRTSPRPSPRLPGCFGQACDWSRWPTPGAPSTTSGRWLSSGALHFSSRGPSFAAPQRAPRYASAQCGAPGTVAASAPGVVHPCEYRRPSRPFTRVFPDFDLVGTHKEFTHAPPLPVRRLPGARLMGWHLWGGVRG